MKKIFYPLALFALTLPAGARDLKGKVTDAKTGEQIIGAIVRLKSNPNVNTTTGYDGSFTLTVDDATEPVLLCSYIGYESREIRPTADNVSITLTAMDLTLGTATVQGRASGNTEIRAREIERNSMNVVNVMSAKAIELSPDLTVANVLQRMSGLVLEKNESGEGQYAILRGMDKRYNYTLVNGVKIPSPDNKNRFVPLDIFPSELLDRLEVTKSLTADMEADGIGGAINMVMKDAPRMRQLDANFSVGYNAQYFNRSFASYGASGVNHESPYERFGASHVTTDADFDMKPLKMEHHSPIPDLRAGISYGDRFADDRLGLIVAANVQNYYTGKKADLYYQEDGQTPKETNRLYSEQQTRFGAHAKLDYAWNDRNHLNWYNGYMYLRSAQTRIEESGMEEVDRMKLNMQGIFNSTLSGNHKLLEKRQLTVDWRASYGYATNQTPDRTTIYLNTARTGAQFVSVNPAATRRWEHNSDQDIAGYLDLTYHFDFENASALDLKAGGMYRDKDRGSFFNEYTFEAPSGQRRGEDWTNFDEVDLDFKRRDISNPLNYDAHERIGAAYVMGKWEAGRFELNAGLRMEHTDQGYVLMHSTSLMSPDGTTPYPSENAQKYFDWLPSLHAKMEVHENANVRFSYAEAINRPSFYEIVPYRVINEDYHEVGNPLLKRTVAHNFDLRYEFFPNAMDQLMVGVFYKLIKDPIEYGMIHNAGQDLYLGPNNYGDARNLGLEVDVTKYFNWFGVKANYTYTHSEITTDKRYQELEPDGSIARVTRRDQSRPLYGQAAHVFNLSLLFKDTKYGWNGQLAFGYTGKRIAAISQDYDNDIWEAGRPSLDASVEKKFRGGWTVFAKASNLLNLPVVRYYHQNAYNDRFKEGWELHDGGIVERKERFGQSFLVGVRFKLQ